MHVCFHLCIFVLFLLRKGARVVQVKTVNVKYVLVDLISIRITTKLYK